MSQQTIKSVMKKMLAATTLAILMTFAPIAHAQNLTSEYINLGTLDMRPLNQNDWFVLHLDRGEKTQQYFEISNFSNQTRELTLYTTDLKKNEDKNYYVKSPDQISDEIAPWIQLPANQITLQPGESKILSAQFIMPQNAGVGLHEGAIIARETRVDPNAPYQNIAIEKGIRVYLTVKGLAIKDSQITKAQFSTLPSQITTGITVKNTGTVDLKQTYQLKLNSLYGEGTFTTQTTSRITPETEKTIQLQSPKPSFGLYTVDLYIKDAETNRTILTQNVGNTLYVPFSLLALALGLSLSASFTLALRKRKVCFNIKSVNVLKHELVDQLDFVNINIRRAFQSPQVQRAAIYTGLLAITGLIVYNMTNIDAQDIQTQVIRPDNLCKYDLTVKWGNFRNLDLPNNYNANWQGRIYFPNAKIETIELLDAERNDKIEITGNKTSINFTSLTGPDNDGVIITLIPTNDEPIRAEYTNNKTGTEYKFEVTDYLHSPGIIPEGKFATYLETQPCKEQLAQRDIETLRPPKEIFASADQFATPEVQQVPLTRKIPELENLFTEELPATPEILADVILESDYVKKVVEENTTKRVELNNILLNALSATPEILAEISATPDLNYIYLPSDTIAFPPISFSFDQSKTTAQQLGTMIFVQNKGTTWNTYISTTDFQSLSSEATIPASNIEIDPGEPELLGSFIVKDVPDPEPTPTPTPEPTPVYEKNSINAGSEFNGKSSSIQTTNADTIEFTDAVTVEAWAYLQNSGSYKVVQKGDWNGFGLGMDKWNGWQAHVYLDDEIGPKSINWTKGRPKLKQWYHLAMTYDGTTLKLYVDGKEDSHLDIEGRILNRSQQVTIGSDSGKEEFFSGQIDEVRIWNRVLSEQEIQVSMTQSTIENIQSQDGLVGYWPLNELEGSTAYDRSPNKLDAVATDVIWTENTVDETKEKQEKIAKSTINNGPGTLSTDPTFAATINESVVMDSATFESMITSGNIHKFQDALDSASLIVADPTPGKKIIFMLRPTVKVQIPANTLPGTYQGSLTITSL